MSILIKGIDLPRNGDCHHITIYDNGDTYMTTSNRLYETDRKDVEAIQIPKGHGRLIDAKVFADTICQAIQSGDLIQKSIWEWIADAPTILEEEK